MRTGKQMQFFGARCNLAKTLLYAINGGRDELTGKQVASKFEPIRSEYLDYDEVMEKFDNMMDWVARVYINALNIIHFMHDKYSYEALEMALHDRDVFRTMACGIAGLSKWAFRGSRQRACALLDEDGTQTRYQAAPYDGTGRALSLIHI